MGLWHINTLDFGNVQHLKGSAAGITVLGLLLDGRFLPSRTGSCSASAACVVGFCGHDITPSFNTRLISPFLHTKAQAVARLELP